MAYQFRGKSYMTVDGLLNALKKDSGGATSFSMVINNQIRAFADDRKTVLVTYDVTPPVYGQLQVVTRVGAAPAKAPASPRRIRAPGLDDGESPFHPIPGFSSAGEY